MSVHAKENNLKYCCGEKRFPAIKSSAMNGTKSDGERSESEIYYTVLVSYFSLLYFDEVLRLSLLA
jgi:hypothetical protein